MLRKDEWTVDIFKAEMDDTSKIRQGCVPGDDL